MKISAYNILFHPFHPTHTSELKTFSIITIIALSVLTLGLYVPVLGIVHLWEWAKQKFQDFENQKVTTVSKREISQNARPFSSQATKSHEITTIPSTQDDSDFFKNITPANIDEMLNVHEDGTYKEIKKCFLSVERHVFNEQEECENEIQGKDGEVGYWCFLELPKGSQWMWTYVSVKNNRFQCTQTVNPTDYLRGLIPPGDDYYFDNFEQVLYYLFKGDFYRGEFFDVDFFVLHKKDNSEVVCRNPFRK